MNSRPSPDENKLKHQVKNPIDGPRNNSSTDLMQGVKVRVRSMRKSITHINYYNMSTNYTIFLEAKVIHRFVHSLLYLLPVSSTLDEFVDVLIIASQH